MMGYFFLGLAVGVILGVIITVVYAICARSSQVSDQEGTR